MTSSPESESRVLILAPTGRDAVLAAGVLEEAEIRTKRCGNVDDLAAEIRSGAGAVLITEEALTPDTAAELAEVFHGQLPWSDLPLLVFSGGAVRRETLPPAVARLADLANVTLLDRPTRKVTLVSSVRTALRARRRQYEVRDLLGQLEANVRDRDQFLAILSHELRNPLAAIMNAAELMERRATPEASRELAIVERQGLLLSRLVDDLLDVARVTRGKVALKRTRVEVGELVERALQSISTSAASRRIRLSFESGSAPFAVDGDRFRLEQVVHNLLTNAVKYTPPGGSIRVRLDHHPEEGWGEIRVEDSGSGIEPAMLPKIFEPFAQADATIDRSQGGLGLGLTLVRELVDLHDGTVRAESPGPDLGSTFVVRLPALMATEPADSASADAPSLSGAAAATSTARRVLLVEDNPDVRLALGDLLRDVGFEVFDAADGEEGVAIALESRPDAVLVDIGLPRLDGYGVARRLRRELPPPVLLVALTGYGSGEDRRRAFDAGFDDHLTKPVALGAVLDLLARKSPRARRAASAR
jgi:signal transduction histidine kinase/ActR/RegA family two-component response regulator